MTNTIVSGFGARSTALEIIEGHRFDGKNVIVTGAASGIGVETARAFAHAGASVTLAVRDTAKGSEVAKDLEQSSGNTKVHVAKLDLSSLTSVRQFAQEYLKDHGTLNVLINNAGIRACPLAYTEDNFESQFGTNHLGHFLLSVLLMPALKAAAPSRVVSLTSIGHRYSGIHFDDINYRHRPYEPWEAYGQSKTANSLFAVELTARGKEFGITSNSVMPGGIISGLQKHIPIEEQRQRGWIDEHGNINPDFKTPEQGASTSVWAAVAPELEGIGGLYLENCQPAKLWHENEPMAGYQPHAVDKDTAAELWDVSEQMVKAKL